MNQSSTRSNELRSLLPDVRVAITTGVATAVLAACSLGMYAQSAPADAGDPAAQPPAATAPVATANLSNKKQKKQRKEKAKPEKVVASKDTRQAEKRVKRDNALAGQDLKLPDKELYDKAEDAIKHGRYDVGRIDLQTLLNTYPDSQFMMRAKLAIADSWYKEGGTAALTQAEQEYKDFITFFPNSPEAAEAQMRVGDIYFRQMDKPDRDYQKTLSAEREYRLMLQQFPDSPLVPQAQQRLREVQEVLASREANIAQFYAERQPPDIPGAIARYQTVVDTYPLYSRMDDVLLGLGDAYASQAKAIRAFRLPEASKAKLEKIYDDEASACYRKVVLDYSASPHVEDAKDRLVGMGLPVPTPTPEQVAASAALENSRGQYTLSKRATLFFLHQADTVPAATVGAPPLQDPAPVTAPQVVKKEIADFNDAITHPDTPERTPAAGTALQPATTTAAAAPAAEAAPAAAAAPLAFQDVPSEGSNSSSGAVVTNDVHAAPAPTGASGTGLGVEIVQPDSSSPQPRANPSGKPPAFPGDQPADSSAAPAGNNAAPASAAPATNQTGGIGPVGPPNTQAMAPIEKPDAAPEALNEAKPTAGAPVPVASTGKKHPKPAFDKSEESSSKHKKKKGLDKLNPF